MLLYNAIGPNPKAVRMFMAERGIDLPMAGKQFVCGDRLSLADVMLFAFVDFFAGAGQPLNPELATVTAWHGRIKQRPSAAA
jgi:glutathione S-transferase